MPVLTPRFLRQLALHQLQTWLLAVLIAPVLTPVLVRVLAADSTGIRPPFPILKRCKLDGQDEPQMLKLGRKIPNAISNPLEIAFGIPYATTIPYAISKGSPMQSAIPYAISRGSLMQSTLHRGSCPRNERQPSQMLHPI